MGKSAAAKQPETEAQRHQKQMRVLRAVSAINAVMFVVESASGYFAHSTAMVSDSLDMLSDALGAGTSVLVGKSGPRKQAWVALAKAGVSAMLGLGVLATAGFLFFNPVMPVAAAMGVIGGMALAANATCAALLFRYRKDSLNLSATWKCKRNDIISNVGVLGAAALSHVLLSPLPDIAVGVLVSGLFVKSSISIAAESIGVLRATGQKKQDKKAQAASPSASAPQPAPKQARQLQKALWRIFNRKAAVEVAVPQEEKAPAIPVPAKVATPVASKAA